MIKKFLSIFKTKNDNVGYNNYIRVEYGREYNMLIKNGLSEREAINAIASKITA